MALRYTRLQSTLDVEIIGEVTMTGSAVDVKIVDLTAGNNVNGVRNVTCIIQNASLTGDVTLVARGNTAANGTGTDTTIATMVIDQSASHTQCVLEIPAELLSHYSDRSTDGYFKSLVFDATGTNTDTLDACIIVEPLIEQDGLTPSDVTTVS
jgi:Tfp pilus assembly protein PilV